MSAYKLYYFNGRGRAEVTRLIFAAAGQKFEDIRYNQGEWSKRKSQMPLGQMPVLEHNGVKLPQSMAIARFLAKEFHLAGRDNFEQAKVDAVVDTIHDGVSKFSPLRWIKDATKKQDRLKKFLTEDLPTNLQHLEVLGKLYGNGGSFFVANRLSWADLYFYDSTENFLEADRNILGNYPWLKHNRQEVEKQPNISTYLKSRPRTVF